MITERELNKAEAIRRLVGGGVSGNTDGTNIVYHDGQTPPTDAEIDAELVRMQAEYDAQEYARKREAEYPSIPDQLDEIYHNGVNAWKAVIKKTKDKYPKG